LASEGAIESTALQHILSYSWEVLWKFG